ncbi:MAG TPA: D-alanine--D-alanine ligase A [Clostridiales bacterium]|nr:D-alanine--D-alanine ligase A [Clostridiales bacterium]
MADKLRVGVVFGGRSGEHEVSLVSARSVLRALDPNRFVAVPICITREGRWLLAGDALRALDAGSTDLSGEAVALLGEPGGQGLVSLERAGVSRPLDVVFPVLHGPYGEDGTIQGLLELADVPYVGAGVLGSALGMDKAVQKALLAGRGMPVAEHLVVRASAWKRHPGRIAAAVPVHPGYPCFVKPANLGSSIGITKVKRPEDLASAMEMAFRYDPKVLVEEAVDGREIEVSVLGDEEPQASVCGEIVPSREFYDYQAKYVDGTSALIVPADLPEQVSRQVQAMAVLAFQVLEVWGMARVDFFVGLDSRRVVINELNTIPGFTPISMYPRLWEATGLNYSDLLTSLIDLALQRHRAKSQLETVYRHVPPGERV